MTRSEPLEPGRYLLLLTCEGFEPRSESVDVRRGEETVVLVTLRRPR